MASLYNIRSVVICLLAFAALASSDLMTLLSLFDPMLRSGGDVILKLFILSSKTDYYRDGACHGL